MKRTPTQRGKKNPTWRPVDADEPVNHVKVMKKLTFFYDFISPYSYLAFKRVKELRKSYGSKLPVVYKPVLFAGLLNHWGSKGPAEVPPKREFVFRDVYRCELVSLPFFVSHPTEI